VRVSALIGSVHVDGSGAHNGEVRLRMPCERNGTSASPESPVKLESGVIPKTGTISTMAPPPPGAFHQTAAPDWEIPHIGNAADGVVGNPGLFHTRVRAQGPLRSTTATLILSAP
jgi:hypothetical protein